MRQRLTTSSLFLIPLLVFFIFTSGVAEANNAPTTVGTISDQALDVGGTDATVDVSSNFSDPDSDTLTYTAASSDEAVATVSVSDSTVTITAVAAGTATITVTATDPSGETAEQTISVTVTQPNRAPTAVGTIPDQTVIGSGLNGTVDVSGNFSDPDGDTLTYTAESSDTDKVGVSVSGATVTIRPVRVGSATVTVTATDPDGLTAEQSISVTVQHPNRSPNVVDTIPNQTLNVGNNATVDISSVFSDPDGDTLTYTVSSSDSSIATASVSGTTVTITPVAPGTATIGVTATDPDGLPGVQNISVTVPNRAPVRVGSYSDVTLTAGAIDWHLIVTLLFSDPDGESLTYSASTTDTVPVDVNMVQNGTVLSVTPKAAGSVVITITATDAGGLSATQSFNLRVIGPNRAPETEGTIPDSALEIGGSAADVDVSSYFTDPNSDTLTYTAASSDTSIATVSVSSATVTTTAVGEGTATITVTATDTGDLTATQTFSVTVTHPNRAPAAVGTIADQSPTIDGNAATVDVSANFSDADGDTLTYTATSDDTAVATVEVSSATVSITAVSSGSATITVTATDPDGLSATQTFSVATNSPPIVSQTIPDYKLKKHWQLEGAGLHLNSNFSDPDGDSLTYTWSYPSWRNIVHVHFNQGNHRPYIVQITNGNTGTVSMTVTATDPDGASVSQTFTVTVSRPPTASGTISDQNVNIGEDTVLNNLENYFEDGDNETLTYTVSSSDTSKAAVSVSDATLTITGVASGTATITVTATDFAGFTANQTFTATVVNRAPTVVTTISEQWVHGVGNTVTFDLDDYFSDADGDTLTYTATSSNTDKVTVPVTRDTVTITVVAGGRSTITVTAADPDGATAEQTFTAVVTEDIPDQQAVVGGGILGVSASSVVHFGRNPGDLFVYAATSSDTSILTITTPHLPTFGNSAYLGINPVSAGTATVTAKLTYGNSRTHRSFTVTVFQGPSAVGTIPDKTLHYGGPDSPSTPVDLSDYFDAIDMSDLTYTAVSSDTSKVTVSLSGATLSLTPVAAGGSSTITTRATDSNTAFATQTFTTTVKGPPVPNGTIPNQTLNTGGSPVTINVAGYFIEPDGQAMTFPTVNDSFLGSEELVTPSISGSILTLTPGTNPQNLTKSGTVTVVAEDTDGYTGVQRFTLTVVGPNRAPAASGTIPNITKKASDSAVDVDLSGYFTDADGDTLTYTAISSDTSKATVSLSDATLTVTPVAAGTPTITATATDPDGEFATQSFTMTVNVANRAPVASTTIPNQTLPRVYAPNDSSVILSLENYFSDPDGDALTYTAPLNDTSKVVVLNFYHGPSKLRIFPPLANATGNSGTGSITVTATDIDNATVSQTFSVTTSIPPATVGTISTQAVKPGATSFLTGVPEYFSDADGDTLSYSVSNSDESVMTVGLSGNNQTVSMSGADDADVTVTLTATDPAGFSASHSFRAIVAYSPNTVGTMPNQTMTANQNSITIDVSSYFSDPNNNGNGLALTYSASSSNPNAVTVSMSGKDLTISKAGFGTSTITVTATNTAGLSANQSFSAIRLLFADATPQVSSDLTASLAESVAMDRVIFNELRNASTDTQDWIELRNVTDTTIDLNAWRLSVDHAGGTAEIVFKDVSLAPGGVLLIVNTAGEAAVSRPLIAPKFLLPQEEVTLFLWSPTGIEDIAGSAFSVDTTLARVVPVVLGYESAAWTASLDQNGLGTPGYRPSTEAADLNNDGVVDILDLVAVAGQIGQSAANNPADVNGDGTVDVLDLRLVAAAF